MTKNESFLLNTILKFVRRLTSVELDPSPEDVVLFSVAVILPGLEEDENGPLPFGPLGLFCPLNLWHCTKPISKMKNRKKVPFIAVISPFCHSLQMM